MIRQSYPSGFSRRKFGGLLECAAIHLLPCSAGGKGTSNPIFPPFFKAWQTSSGEIRAGLIRKKAAPERVGMGQNSGGSQFGLRLVLQRSGNRSRHRQHPGLREGRGDYL